MQTIPLLDTYAQTFKVTLGGQPCQIDLRQKSTGMYLNLTVNDAPIVTGVACSNLARMVRGAYLGFEGDLVFFDSQGDSDPSSPGLGSRYLLQYLEASELA